MKAEAKSELGLTLFFFYSDLYLLKKNSLKNSNSDIEAYGFLPAAHIHISPL